MLRNIAIVVRIFSHTPTEGFVSRKMNDKIGKRMCQHSWSANEFREVGCNAEGPYTNMKPGTEGSDWKVIDDYERQMTSTFHT
jgi:hypothetical protein